MKYLYFIFAILAFTTSCELRTTNFDPDNQLVSEDELAKIAVWDQYQTEQLSTGEYESQNPHEFVSTEFEYRQNHAGKWVIEGSIRNFASEAHFEDMQLAISYYTEASTLIGTDNYTIDEQLTPGDRTGFYFKSDRFKEAHSLVIEIIRVRSVKH